MYLCVSYICVVIMIIFFDAKSCFGTKIKILFFFSVVISEVGIVDTLISDLTYHHPPPSDTMS